MYEHKPTTGNKLEAIKDATGLVWREYGCTGLFLSIHYIGVYFISTYLNVNVGASY